MKCILLKISKLSASGVSKIIFFKNILLTLLANNFTCFKQNALKLLLLLFSVGNKTKYLTSFAYLVNAS